MSLGAKVKDFVRDFPHQGGTTVVALILILAFGVVVVVRFALGKIFPDGYEGWMIFLATLAGVATGGMIGKRATDFRYKAAGQNSPSTVVNADSASVTGGPVEVKPPEARPADGIEGG